MFNGSSSILLDPLLTPQCSQYFTIYTQHIIVIQDFGDLEQCSSLSIVITHANYRGKGILHPIRGVSLKWPLMILQGCGRSFWIPTYMYCICWWCEGYLVSVRYCLCKLEGTWATLAKLMLMVTKRECFLYSVTEWSIFKIYIFDGAPGCGQVPWLHW